MFHSVDQSSELILFLISALQDNINIEEAARFLVGNILMNHQSFPNEDNDGDKIKLHQEVLPAERKSQCCWCGFSFSHACQMQPDFISSFGANSWEGIEMVGALLWDLPRAVP